MDGNGDGDSQLREWLGMGMKVHGDGWGWGGSVPGTVGDGDDTGGYGRKWGYMFVPVQPSKFHSFPFST